MLKIVPSSESKNFSSTVTATVPVLSAAGSGGLKGTPGKGCPFDAPRKYAVAIAPSNNPAISIKRFLVTMN